MYGRMFIFVKNFHVNNLSVVLEIFHVFNFVGQGYPQKLFNLEHFPIYGSTDSTLRGSALFYSHNRPVPNMPA